MKVSYLHNEQIRTDMLRATMKQMEVTLQDYPMIVRCHRAFLVNLGQVERIVSHSGSIQLLIKHCHESLPVSRSNMSQVKAAIKSI
jgi:DNA-binding LytR/AlgR family response regulator